jgi:replicative DNA helicase
MMAKQYSLLPSSRELEEAVIGCVLNGGEEDYDRISDKIPTPEVFYYGRNRLIWGAVKACAGAGKPITPLTICDRLSSEGSLEEIGGALYVKHLASSNPDASALGFNAGRVAEDASRRELIDRLSVMHDEAHNRSIDLPSVMGRLDDYDYRTVSSESCKGIGDTIDTTAKEILHAYENPGEVRGLPTGVSFLNRVLGGWQPGEIVILASRPSVGKTAMALFSMMNMGACCYFVSAEMTRRMIEMRMLGNYMGLPSHMLRSGSLNKDEVLRLDSAVNKVKKLDIIVEDQTKDIEIISREAYRLHREKGLQFIAIDYVQLLNYFGPNAGNREREVAMIISKLKDVAKKLDIPVLALCQLKRVEADRRPVLSDLRESGSLEQDADTVVFLHRDGEPGSTDILDCIIAKHRQGATGSAVIRFDGSTGTFSELGQNGGLGNVEEGIEEQPPLGI